MEALRLPTQAHPYGTYPSDTNILQTSTSRPTLHSDVLSMFIVIGSAVTGKSAFCCTNHANIYASQSTYLNYSILNNYISKGCIGLKPYLLQYQQHHQHHYSTHPTHKPNVYPLTKGDGCPPYGFFPVALKR